MTNEISEFNEIREMIGASNYQIAEINSKLNAAIPLIKEINVLVDELRAEITELKVRVTVLELDSKSRMEI